MAATIKDIREKTGLSLATISKYLNGGNLLPENRRKIEAAVAELHYEVNELARGLVTSKTQTIGMVVYGVENLFCGKLIKYAGCSSAGKCNNNRNPGVYTLKNKYCRNNCTKRHSSVNRQIRKIKYAVCKINTESKNSIFEALLQHNLYNV